MHDGVNRIRTRKVLLGTYLAGDGVAREICEPSRYQVAHITAHELTVRSTSRRHVGGVVRRDAVLFGDGRRAREERRLGADEPAVDGYCGYALAKSMCWRVVPP